MKPLEFSIRFPAGLLICFCSVGASAQVSPALDRFSLSVGAFSSAPEINATLGSALGPIPTGALEARRKAMPRVSGEFLLGDNHAITLEAYRYSKGYSNSYAWGNYRSTYPDNGGTADLKLGFDLDVARLGYRYWFGTGKTVLGLGAGVGYYRISLKTQVAGTSVSTFPGAGFAQSEGSYSRQDEEDAFAPMLELGLRHAVNPSFRLFADASGIHKGGSGVRGGIYNASAGVEWLPFRNVGISLAYAVTDVDLKRNNASLQRLRVKLDGLMLSLKARF